MYIEMDGWREEKEGKCRGEGGKGGKDGEKVRKLASNAICVSQIKTLLVFGYV